jgi:hypothetical protein
MALFLQLAQEGFANSVTGKCYHNGQHFTISFDEIKNCAFLAMRVPRNKEQTRFTVAISGI